MANTGQDWEASWTDIDVAPPITLTFGGVTTDVSDAQSNDLKSGCEISIDATYSNHALGTPTGLIVYILRDVNGTDYEDFDDGGFAFAMPFTQDDTHRKTIAIPPDMTSRFKIGLQWLNDTTSSNVTVYTKIKQADIPLAS